MTKLVSLVVQFRRGLKKKEKIQEKHAEIQKNTTLKKTRDRAAAISSHSRCAILEKKKKRCEIFWEILNMP